MRRIRSLLPLLPLLAATVVATPAAADTYPRQPGIDIRHYVFRVALHDDRDAIEGETTVELRFLEDGVREVALDLASVPEGPPAGSASGKGMKVASVAETLPSGEERALSFRHEGERLKIALASPSARGASWSATIRYAGTPASGLRIGPNRYGERTFFSDNWPTKAHQWLPLLDHPYDKATGEMIVTAPAHYQVVSNGLLIEETDLPGGMRRTHWRQSVPLASWLFALGAARFAVHQAGPAQGVALQSWVFPQDREAGLAGFEAQARAALDFYAAHFGPFPYEKLANVQAAGIHGGMENATTIFYGEESVTGPKIAQIVAHEVAHQWFGDSVTERDWDDVWLSEGFATYLTLLFNEGTAGREAFVTGLRDSRTRVLTGEAKNPGEPVRHRNLADMGKVLNDLVYQKGAWTLHMLRRRVGEDAFWKGMAEYYRRYRDANASTDEFRQVMEGASGQDLGPFLSQWLDRSGVPRLSGSWRYDAVQKKIEVTLEQSQAGEPYRLPVAIGVQAAPPAPVRLERVELDGRRATYIFPSDDAPRAVTLDPETDLLMEAGPFVQQP